MGALVVTYADWTTRPRGESTRPDLAGMGLTSSVGPLLTTATLPQARQATHPPSGVPRCTTSEAAAVRFPAFTTDIAIKYYATNRSNSQNAKALGRHHWRPHQPGRVGQGHGQVPEGGRTQGLLAPRWAFLVVRLRYSAMT
jgi:hypothetical protein